MIGHSREAIVEIDEIVAELSNSFDYEFTGKSTFEPFEKPLIPDSFGIGLIVGGSGTGKSTLLESFGEESEIDWDASKAVCSHFNDAEDASERLSSVGFSSVPDWMKPYHVLSTGQKFRADLAMRIKDNAVVDEFTSTVDRNVGKSCSVALRRYVDKKGI
jgi:ABC-type polar amino acid transport system ATPase subunit